MSKPLRMSSRACSRFHATRLARPIALASPIIRPRRSQKLGIAHPLVRMSTATPSSAVPSPPGRGERILFGPFDVTTQVFLTTAHSFALVNLKPLLPGHVLVCTRRPHRRLTDLSPPEVADLFTAVQRVQHMLARYYFGDPTSSDADAGAGATADPPRWQDWQGHEGGGNVLDGSFNIAVQDGAEAGQTVPHVHVHVIPRIRGTTAKPASTPSDAVYEGMASEEGNVGGALWDRERLRPPSRQRTVPDRADGSGQALPSERPRPGGGFPRIEDADRLPRSMDEMEAEAGVYRGILEKMTLEEKQGKEAAGRE
ncbi:hypothetical protein VTJ83DRAFT_4897 [Remersonia thermophila]|uniref:Bis(5'-adenosyl)-triphosphatase n=1 Tax=Remersonia thermophila TaxID=72144 RepID=A0ABR4DB94_9PEZI